MQDLILYIKKNYEKPENGLMKVILTFFLVFSALLLLKVGTMILKKGDTSTYTYIVEHMRLSTNWKALLDRPWTIITYVFAQNVGVVSFIRLFFQMTLVYTLGSQFVSFFNSRKFVRLYISSIIFAGGSLLLISHFSPYIKEGGYLEGTAVAIYALVAAIATIMPNLPLLVMQTQYVAIFCVLLSLWDITELSYAARGVAKLAGMLWGYLYVIFLRANMRSFFASSSNKKKHEKNYKNGTSGKQNEHVEYLLDKIAEKGYNNLTDQEKKDLFESGK